MFAYCNNNPVNKIDSTGKEPGDLFDTIEDAAIDAARYIGPDSFYWCCEYCVAIYSVKVPVRNVKYVTKKYRILGITFTTRRRVVTISFKTRYTYTHKIHSMSAIQVEIAQAPPWGKRVAIVHTHPMGSGSGVTRISDKDIYNADGAEESWDKYIVYVYGPDGKLKWYNPFVEKNKVGTVDIELPKSKYTPWIN